MIQPLYYSSLTYLYYFVDDAGIFYSISSKANFYRKSSNKWIKEKRDDTFHYLKSIVEKPNRSVWREATNIFNEIYQVYKYDTSMAWVVNYRDNVIYLIKNNNSNYGSLKVFDFDGNSVECEEKYKYSLNLFIDYNYQSNNFKWYGIDQFLEQNKDKIIQGSRNYAIKQILNS